MSAAVTTLDRLRIERSLPERARYKYVKPEVLPAPEGGWLIRSPCCSRNVDPDGGVIDIAWFQQLPDGSWRLYAREHREHRWRCCAEDPHITPLLLRLTADPRREFWQ